MKRFIFMTVMVMHASVFAGDFDFNGGVIVNGCSGALMMMEGMRPEQPALVMTNGHCVDIGRLSGGKSELLGPGEYLFDYAHNVTEQVVVVVRSPGGASQTVKVERLVFATMTGTDVAIYQLRESYQELEKRYQVKPLTLDRGPVISGTPVVLVSNYYAEMWNCEMGEHTSLLEGPYTTTRGIQLGHGCHDIYIGISGSPILRAGTRSIVGLANTHFSGSGAPCTFNNPCEYDSTTGKKKTPAPGQTYGVTTSELYLCFDEQQRVFNFGLIACPYQARFVEGHGGQIPL